MSRDLSIWSEMMNCLISRLEFLIIQKIKLNALDFRHHDSVWKPFCPQSNTKAKAIWLLYLLQDGSWLILHGLQEVARWHTVWHSFYSFKKPSQQLNKLESLTRMRMQLTERLPNMPRRSAGYIAFQKQPGMPLLFDEDGIDQPFPMPVGKPSYIQGSRSSKTIHWKNWLK